MDGASHERSAGCRRVGRDGDDLFISTAAGRRMEKNVRRDSRVGLTVHDCDDPLRYAEVCGSAVVTEGVGREPAVALAEQYGGPGAGREYLDLPPENVRVVMRITPRRLLGNATS